MWTYLYVGEGVELAEWERLKKKKKMVINRAKL